MRRRRRLALAAAAAAAAVLAWAALGGMSGKSSETPRSPAPDVASEAASGIDWDYWLGINPDIVAWLAVPGTDVDCPVVRAPASDPGYYLSHDVYGEYNVYGTPYLDSSCEGILSAGGNAVVFGHNMMFGPASEFSPFADYADAGFAAEHREVVLATPDGEETRLSVAGADVVDGGEAAKRTSFVDGRDLRLWLEDSLARADVSFETDPESVESCATFVTCSYYRNPLDERTVVYAVR